MSYVYIQTEFAGRGGAENHLYTVGFYDPKGEWHGDSDHSTREEAAKRVAYLNGADAVRRTLDEALNSGDGSYRP